MHVNCTGLNAVYIRVFYLSTCIPNLTMYSKNQKTLSGDLWGDRICR